MSTGESIDNRGSTVRFETQCIVIPDLEPRSRRPRVVTKSYTLPLWKKRASSACPPPTVVPPEDVPLEENQPHLVLRVPLPTLSPKFPPVIRSVDQLPLPPCLVHRAQPSDPSYSLSPAQHTRTSRKPSPSRSDVITVPLRPCCAACHPVTEAAFISGEAWPEQFSHAASRRRSMCAGATLRTITVAGSVASASYGALGVSISVDEIDKRRRLSDMGSSMRRQSNDVNVQEEYGVPLILRHATASGSFTTDSCTLPSPTCAIPATPGIPEEEDNENENELFPLPSPRRTPTTSPSPSPAGSLSSLMVTRTSPTPSTCSEDTSNRQPNKRHFLEPPRCSCSSPSLPKPSESTTGLAFIEGPPRIPSPNLLSNHPSLSGHPRSRSSSPRISFVALTPTDASAVEGTPLQTPQTHMVVAPPIDLPPSPRPSPTPVSPRHSPVHIRIPWRSKRSVSADFISRSHPHTPLSSTIPPCSLSTPSHLSSFPSTRKQFSISSRHIIADVLRGVGAMGSASGIGAGTVT